MAAQSMKKNQSNTFCEFCCVNRNSLYINHINIQTKLEPIMLIVQFTVLWCFCTPPNTPMFFFVYSVQTKPNLCFSNFHIISRALLNCCFTKLFSHSFFSPLQHMFLIKA